MIGHLTEKNSVEHFDQNRSQLISEQAVQAGDHEVQQNKLFQHSLKEIVH